MSTKRIQIIGGFPQSDWEQTDETKTDYIKNKITKVSELQNDMDYAITDEVATAKSEAITAANEALASARDELLNVITTKVDTTTLNEKVDALNVAIADAEVEAKNYADTQDEALKSELGITLDGKSNIVHTHTVANITDLTATTTELNYVDGVTSNIQEQLDTKANKADIATTAMLGSATENVTYAKISNFGNWGTGIWYQKGFSMLITSRAGETIWVSVSSNDSDTAARAIRLFNTYSKIAAIYYSASESAVYVKAAGWCNNINAHIISNVNGDYVPTIETVSALANDVVEINIVEFGTNSTSTVVGDNSVILALGGSGDRPTYNSSAIALLSDVPTTASDIGAAASSHGTHVSYSSTAPVMDGTASVGSASTVARSDHRHPTDTSRAPMYTYGTGNLTANSSSLTTGTLYFAYE